MLPARACAERTEARPQEVDCRLNEDLGLGTVSTFRRLRPLVLVAPAAFTFCKDREPERSEAVVSVRSPLTTASESHARAAGETEDWCDGATPRARRRRGLSKRKATVSRMLTVAHISLIFTGLFELNNSAQLSVYYTNNSAQLSVQFYRFYYRFVIQSQALQFIVKCVKA